jgi:hypothetical protein
VKGDVEVADITMWAMSEDLRTPSSMFIRWA